MSEIDSKLHTPEVNRPGKQDFVSESYPIDDLITQLREPNAHVQVTGVSAGLKAALLADLSRRVQRPLLIVTADSEGARNLTRDLGLFVSRQLEELLKDDVVLFPEFDVGPYHQASADRKLTLARTHALWALTRPIPPRFLVTSIRACMRKSIPVESMKKWSMTLSIGGEWDNTRLREAFTTCGFSEVTLVEDPATYAIRGDVVDVFSPAHEDPIRIERWGDDIAEMRTFDVKTQRTRSSVERCDIFPARTEVLNAETIRKARVRIRALGSALHVPSKTMSSTIADLDAGLHFVGIDSLLPAFYEGLNDIFDYLPENFLLVVDEPDLVISQAQDLEEKRRVEHAQTVEDQELAFGYEDHYRESASALQFLGDAKRVEFRRIAIETADSPLPLAPEGHSHAFTARPNSDIVQLRKRHNSVEETMEWLQDDLDFWKQRFGRICFACRTRGQIERLESLLKRIGEDPLILEPPIDVTEPVPPPAGVIEIYHGEISEGFRSELLSLAVISGHEIFGNRGVSATTASFTEHAAISHFRDLTPGDFVVHLDFGIGRYQGLVRLEVAGIANDFLHLEYAGSDKLYLPVYRLGRVQKYIGSPNGVRLDKLGGTNWQKTKDKVKSQIRDIAQDLLQLYAERELRKGHAFSPPDESYFEFEAAFPFEETPDQARAIQEVLDDMMRPRPMDRLVCGDVGFGKTEVAIRAAMKAALDGKQTAVLVPTTILCEQHLVSFRKRCEPFGVRVESLNRFRTTKESKDIIEATRHGKVDILIGTHRLLGKSVEFRDLRLLVVDEEQRFGVTHKEQIKQMRANIDCLTLTATPIPRTLQMSLLGIRDLSIIATPPHDRLSVRTHLARFNDGIIREAIIRELSRGGQVFFVHNRVQTIEEMREHISDLVPEARVRVAHGQMNENKLEEVMVAYVRGETNVLLASTIIESGLDIPNANTIIINRADMFGLSQLYQLRGRVGRGKERAYAYMLIPAKDKLNKDAEKRLEVIQTHTELGSGFQVATYDLEIRGSGNLLSDDQSGHVSAVGLDLYNELLEETVNDLRGTLHENDVEPEVNLRIEAYIPDDYIEATSLRLMFYKRFSLARTMDELFDTFGELCDRFGQAPQPVLNLKAVVELKIRLRGLKAEKLDVGPSAMQIDLNPSTPLNPRKVLDYIEITRGKLRLTADMKLIYTLSPAESADPIGTAHGLLETLGRMA
jgi:transcription-repair coupling factor (superfamily II helicase)